MRQIVYALGLFLLVACSEREAAPAVDPHQNPVPRDAAYYKQHLAEAEAQLAVCKRIPSQARSSVLEGNCVYAARAWRMRDYGDDDASIFDGDAEEPDTP